MKRIFFILLAALTIFSCQKEPDDEPQGLQPNQDQWGFVLEYTSTTCSICGSTGGPLLHDLHEMGNVIAIAAHVNGPTDPMASSISYGFSSDRPSGGGIPSFWVGETKVTTNTTEATNAMSAIKANTPIAGVDLSYTIDSNKMIVETKTAFFEAGMGDYVLSVYVLEDNIDGSSNAGAYKQPGTSSSYPNDDYKHMFVLRDASMGSVYGESIVIDPTAEAVVERTYQFTLQDGWDKSNVYPAAVIWKNDPTASPRYQFINGKEIRN